MDAPFEWEEETKVVDPKVYADAAKQGIVTCLAFGTKIPKKWANKDGTVFGGIKVEEWDGLCVAALPSRLAHGVERDRGPSGIYRLTMFPPRDSHDMILIDELHRNGSLGVGQGLFGGLQIGGSSSASSECRLNPSGSRHDTLHAALNCGTVH